MHCQVTLSTGNYIFDNSSNPPRAGDAVKWRLTLTPTRPFTMLDNLTQRLAKVVKTMRGEARLTEANTAEMLREVRMALLEADVALPAVREFIARVKEKALGEEVISSLSPGQALVGVVQREWPP
jgi:signal recognition particle GTPase